MPGRKHLRRLERILDTDRAPVFYVTTCVQNRARILAAPHIAAILVQAWQDAPAVHGWLVGRYVVMPDHVHFFTAPCTKNAKGLSSFVGAWKQWTRRRIRAAGPKSFAWQREFFDHLLRSGESYNQKWEYVRDNPVRKELVCRPEDWPYQGEVSVLPW